MTSGELKFALAVETVLNCIPQPEYRQLVVEALMVLTLIAERNFVSRLGDVIVVENIVHKANQIFLEDQVRSHVENKYKQTYPIGNQFQFYIYMMCLNCLFILSTKTGKSKYATICLSSEVASGFSVELVKSNDIR